uniref:Uncharacterized protein n=1 Tax=Meloidogyne javanica TaxID=6303 RepID=A0A915LKA0_MELJA
MCLLHGVCVQLYKFRLSRDSGNNDPEQRRRLAGAMARLFDEQLALTEGNQSKQNDKNHSELANTENNANKGTLVNGDGPVNK